MLKWGVYYRNGNGDEILLAAFAKEFHAEIFVDHFKDRERFAIWEIR